MFIKHHLAALLLTSITMLPAAAAEKPAAPSSTAAATERFEIDGVLVERHGQRGRPLILIPGLASGAWVWEDTVRRFSADHPVYVLTLPGFDGRAAVPGQQMALAQAALLQLIESRKLSQPVLIGHSLGGTLALAFAEQHAALVGGVISADGLPVFPGTEALPPPQRQQMVAATQAGMATPSQAVFAEQQSAYMRGQGVLDTTLADSLAVETAKSDPATVGAWVGELMALDLRGELGAIKAPVLVIAPYFEPDSVQLKITEADKKDYYAALLKGVARLEVVTIAPARHFVMFDAPDEFGDAIAAYLNVLK